MLPTQRFDTDDERGVSPVIGVILMVAITVILAAVIASFVLGLGGNNEPAPSPTIDSSISDGENLTLDVTGGDDFDSSVATVQGEVEGVPFDFDMDEGADIDEVTAGTTIQINTTSARINGVEAESLGGSSGTSVSEWEVEIIYDPADQDSTVIYSDSS